MIKNNLIFCLLAIACSSCAQVKDSIGSLNAYYYVRLPGIIAVDASGNPRHASKTIYVVYADAKDSLQKVFVSIDGKSYEGNVSKVLLPAVRVGIRKADLADVVLTPAKGYRLWQISTQPIESKTAILGTPPDIRIKAVVNGKTIEQKVINVVELESPVNQ